MSLGLTHKSRKRASTPFIPKPDKWSIRMHAGPPVLVPRAVNADEHARVPRRPGYFSSVRVPRMLWVLKAPRTDGSRRSISSK